MLIQITGLDKKPNTGRASRVKVYKMEFDAALSSKASASQ